MTLYRQQYDVSNTRGYQGESATAMLQELKQWMNSLDAHY
jgi:hypothetical protein